MRLTLVVLLALTLMPIAPIAHSKTVIEVYQEHIQKLIDKDHELKQLITDAKQKVTDFEKEANSIKALIAKYEADLKTTTQKMEKKNEAQLKAVKDAYRKELSAEADLAELSRKSAEEDAKATRAILDELGTSAEKVAKLTDAVSVSGGSSKTELNISGNIKIPDSANGIVFSDGSKQTRSPRVIYTPDPRNGCSPNAAANTDLWKQTFTLKNPASIVTFANAISIHGGRLDVSLHVDGNAKNRALTDDASVKWQDLHLHWGGTLSQGEHTVSIRSTVANVIGCQENWGNIMTLIFE
ncbi:hypothetical protein [Candidatus Parabeggiatoa sp. HSG14]|uniref:hypothetical protein n=1 Tax=Candidatus Parabeggiatoa sp. HSG14 TaxID=3055593 RepID=UPI0025A74BD6|nr:hypothetical protein [Thiotrichales bacterium HSG14]